MTSSSGQPFSCSIPNVQVEQERLEREKEENAQEETEQDVQRTIDRGLELLEPLGINCIRFFASVSIVKLTAAKIITTTSLILTCK
jgi:hypothetical protein